MEGVHIRLSQYLSLSTVPNLVTESFGKLTPDVITYVNCSTKFCVCIQMYTHIYKCVYMCMFYLYFKVLHVY